MGMKANGGFDGHIEPVTGLREEIVTYEGRRYEVVRWIEKTGPVMQVWDLTTGHLLLEDIETTYNDCSAFYCVEAVDDCGLIKKEDAE